MMVRLLPHCLTAVILLAGLLYQAVAQPSIAEAGGKGCGQITKEKLVTRTYPVADLIVPLDQPMKAAAHPVRDVSHGPMPVPPATAAACQPAPCKTAHAVDRPNVCGVTPAVDRTLENRLMKLIVDMVAPESWSQHGGAGTVDYYPLGMALVISQTPDIQEKIDALLNSLRKLQEVSVVVQVKILSVADTCFERIGIDFEAPTGDCLRSCRNGEECCEVQTVIRSAEGKQATLLNEKQASQFLEAIEGDRRSHIMSAPKMTLLNAQDATIQIGDTTTFVTGVEVTCKGDRVVAVPKKETIDTGIHISVLPVVSADHRTVNLKLNLNLSKFDPAAVPAIPVRTLISSDVEGKVHGMVPYTQIIQLPQVTTAKLNQTVQIPDGGTVLLGGPTIVTETRRDYGPPVLSKIPYVNRLFKNVGIGRETQRLMVMVTPKIIVAEEEEVRPPSTEATKATPGTNAITCPFLAKEAAKKAAPVPECDKEVTVLDNLKKLVEAQKLMTQAELYRRKGKTEQAGEVYEEVEKLCPGSQLARMAAQHREALHGPEVGSAEEAEVVEPPAKKKEAGHLNGSRLEKKVAKLVEKYHQACAEGRLADAQKLASMALALDPACFRKSKADEDR